MKLKNKILILFIFQFLTINAFAEKEILVVPYKIANPTDNFPIETGKDYAKLIALASATAKEITIIPHERVYYAFKNLSLNQQRVITENDLVSVGRLAGADKILVGTLTKTKGGYSSSSVLYSISDQQIVSKAHATSGSLFKLAEDEMNEIFFDTPKRKRSVTDKHVDVVIMCDLSYKVSTEWPSVKKGIIDLAAAVSDNWTLNTAVNIIPFSDKYTSLHKYTGLNSRPEVASKLNTLLPSGTASVKSFQNALNYSVKSIPWRRNSAKILVIISNSENIEGKYIEQYAIAAKFKKIAVNTIALGLLKGNALETLKQFAAAGSGQHYSAVYHQRMFNEQGNPVDIFCQNGRIFQSLVYDDTWKKGLFEDSGRKHSVIEKPKSFLNEIYYDDNKYNINPYNLSKHYPALSKMNIINTEQLNNNVAQMMYEIGENFESSYTAVAYRKSIAKVQITDGKVFFWLQIKDDNDLRNIKSKMSGKHYFPLGVVVKRSPNDPYGIKFDSDLLMTNYGDELIPDMIKTNLSSIIKEPDYFMSRGLLTPPVWFVDIKVEKIEDLRKVYDIREPGR